MVHKTQSMSARYTIQEHTHRFACWAAATGASASPKCRFTVKVGKEILERAGFDAQLNNPEQLPSPSKLDSTHLAWRKRVIKEAKKCGVVFTHGIAAKLINIYLKTKFTCGGYAEHPNVAALHPPIDSLLLKAQNQVDANKRRLRTNWSTFDARTYQEVLNAVRSHNNSKLLWTIESLWQGHR
jgi:hypothetical protein